MYEKMFHLPSQKTPFLVLGEKKRSLGRDYHPLCLKCQKCMRTLTAGQHAEVDKMAFKYKTKKMDWMNEWEYAWITLCMLQHDGKPYCSYCYLKKFCSKGTAFTNALICIQVWNANVKYANLSRQAPGDWCRPGSAQGSISNTDLSQDGTNAWKQSTHTEAENK